MTVRNLDALFQASTVMILGAPQTPAQRQLLVNIESSVPSSRRTQLTHKIGGAHCPVSEMAVVLQADWVDAAFIAGLADSGCKALLWTADEAPGLDILQAAKPQCMRIVGAHSPGVIYAGRHLNLSSLPLMPSDGTVAFIAQSHSVTAAALDWAVGRGVGFSWLAVTGTEVDVDVADLLDYAALDPQTRAVVVQVGNIRNPRKFMSAARAAASVKPVLILQTPLSGGANNAFRQEGGADRARSAAFQRAGLVECDTLGGLFEGLAAMELLSRITGDKVAVIGNGSGVCALAVDAVPRHGMHCAMLTESTQNAITGRIAKAGFPGGAVDTGHVSPQDVLFTVRTVLADPGVDSALLVHSPMAGQAPLALAELLADSAIGERLLTVWLGLQSAQPARQGSALAGLPTFASADEAMQALRYRAQYRRTREMLRQTPASGVVADIDGAGLSRFLQELRNKGTWQLTDDDSAHFVSGYGLVVGPIAAEARTCIVRTQCHPELGMVLGIERKLSDGTHAEYGLPPLDDLLARRMLEATGWSDAGETGAALVSLLIRVGQMVIEQPLIREFEAVAACGADGRTIVLAQCRIAIADPLLPDSRRIALAPYPATLGFETTSRDGRAYAVRAVRPDDEAAVLKLLSRLNPDEIRLRFFSTIRHFSHDMAARMTQIDYDRELTLVATRTGGSGELAALATLVADPDGRKAEYAVLVHHDHARQGLGRHLLEGLLKIAQARGIAEVFGEVLAYNAPMLGLVRSLGFTSRADPGDAGCRHVEIDTTRYAQFAQARDTGQSSETPGSPMTRKNA